MIEYIKQLKEPDVMELIDCAKQNRLERAKEIIGQENNDTLKNVSDSIAKINRAIKYALYRDTEASVYYIPVLVPDDKVAFCVKVY